MSLAALLLSAALFVQDAPPSRIEPRGRPARANPARSEEAEAQRVMLTYAACIVRRRRDGVVRFLAEPSGTDESRRLGDRIAIDDCLVDGELRFNASLFRGALYEALYKKDYSARPLPASFAGVPPIRYSAKDPATLTGRARSWLALNEFADCVVRATPGAVRALIASEVTSAAEAAAFRQVQPALGGCLTSGVELSFSRPVLRGLIAESLYRLTAAASAPAGAPRS